YVTGVYDGTAVPEGKRDLSILVADPASPRDDVVVLSNNMNGRRLDYVEFHTYPTDAAHVSLSNSVNHVRAYFPDSAVILGEFDCASGATSSSAEQNQNSTVLEIANQAEANAVPYYLHWTLWDDSPLNANQIFGLGYDPDHPKDVLGGLSQRLGFLD